MESLCLSDNLIGLGDFNEIAERNYNIPLRVLQKNEI